MKNSIKLALLMNALKNLKVSAKSGGRGSFKMKGLNFHMRDHDIILRKVDNVVKETIHKEGMEGTIASIELEWDFPVGWGKFENGQLEYDSDEEASLSLVVEGLKVIGKNDVFELEHLSLDGIQQIQELFLSLPIEEMAKVAVL